MKQKVYELTTNARDGFAKWMVRGIKDDNHARQISLKGFGEEYSEPKLISYYDDYPSKYGTDWKKESMTIKQFIKVANKQYYVKSTQKRKQYMRTH